MINSNSSLNVYSPTSLKDLLQLYKKIPTAHLYGGGTDILKDQSRKYLKLPENLIYLKKVPELSYITRTERYLEIGSCVTINRILSIGNHVVPEALFSALQSITPPSIKNLVTIGGNIFTKRNTYPVLLLMNISIELKSSDSSRWIQINKLFSNNGKIELSPNEIITRIRIPFETGNKQTFSIFGDLCFCSLANIQKNVLNNINFLFHIFDGNSYRSREVEAEVSGHNLPLSDRTVGYITGLFVSFMEKHDISPYHRAYINNLLTSYLKNLSGEEAVY